MRLFGVLRVNFVDQHRRRDTATDPEHTATATAAIPLASAHIILHAWSGTIPGTTADLKESTFHLRQGNLGSLPTSRRFTIQSGAGQRQAKRDDPTGVVVDFKGDRVALNLALLNRHWLYESPGRIIPQP